MCPRTVSGHDEALAHLRELHALDLHLTHPLHDDVSTVRQFAVTVVVGYAGKHDATGQQCHLSKHAIGTPVSVLQWLGHSDDLSVRADTVNSELLWYMSVTARQQQCRRPLEAHT